MFNHFTPVKRYADVVDVLNVLGSEGSLLHFFWLVPLLSSDSFSLSFYVSF